MTNAAKEARLGLSYGRTLLLAGVLFHGAATSFAQTETRPRASTPGQPIPVASGVSPFSGSVPAKSPADLTTRRASAHEQFISSLHSYNFSKISWARALGVAEEGVKE